jgi:hypothetical protein
MTVPSELVTMPTINPLTQAQCTDNGSFQTDGSGNVISLTAIKPVVVAATGVSVTAGGVTVTAGGISVTAGATTLQAATAVGSLVASSVVNASGLVTAATGISVTAGGITVTAGGISVTAGGTTVAGGLQADQLGGGCTSTAGVATSNAATVATNTRISKVSPTAAVTSCVMATGTFPGQTVTILNEQATGSNAVSFAITSGASNLANAASTIVISGLKSQTFVWDPYTALWY